MMYVQNVWAFKLSMLTILHRLPNQPWLAQTTPSRSSLPCRLPYPQIWCAWQPFAQRRNLADQGTNSFLMNGTWTYAGYTYVHDLTWEILEGLSFVKWDGEEELDTLSQ